MKELVKKYKDIRKDYTYDADIFNGEPDRVRLTKYIINERLTQVERTLIILYADCQSYRKLGKRLGLSHTTIRNEVMAIKAKILKIYEELKDNEHIH